MSQPPDDTPAPPKPKPCRWWLRWFCRAKQHDTYEGKICSVCGRETFS
jgi:hypothetical protein